MENRDYFYDNIKGLLIITVVICHFLGYCMTKSDTAMRSLVLFIYYFHMPLFIFVSGYFSKNPEKCRENAFRSLFMVFLVAQIFWVVFKYLTNGSTYYIQHFLDPGYAIWYIVSLFFWRICLKDILKLRHALVISFLLSPLIMFVPEGSTVLALNKTIGFLFFFLLGHYATTEHLNRFRRLPKYLGLLGLALIFGATFLLIHTGILPYGRTKAIFMHTLLLGEGTSNIWLSLGGYYLSLLVSLVTGICVLIATPEKKTFFCSIGEDTLPLYLSHTYFLILTGLLFDTVAFSHLGSYAFCLGLSIILILIFSTKLYRRCFHGVYQFMIGLAYPKSNSKKSTES